MSLLGRLLILAAAVLFPLSTAHAAENDWSLFGPYGGTITCVAVSPSFGVDNTAFAGTAGRGLFKTTDGGATWTEANSGGVTVWNELTCIALQPGYDDTNGNMDTLLVGNKYDGILRSADGGATWTNVLDDGAGVYGIRSISFAPDGNTVYAGGYYSLDSSGYIFKSTNGGQGWTEDTTWPDHLVLSVLVSPRYFVDGTVYVGTLDDNLWRITSSNPTWHSFSTGLNFTNDVYSLAASEPVSGNYDLYAGTEYGLYRWNGASWDEKSSGFPDGSKTIRTISLSPNYNTDGTMLTAIESRGAFISTDEAETWTLSDSGTTFTHAGAAGIGPNGAGGEVLFAGYTHGGMRKSADGSNWSASSHGITACSPSALGLSPNYATDHVAYAGTLGEGIYRTGDGGASWTEVNGGLVLNGTAARSIMDIAVSPTSTNVAFAAADNGIYRTTDGGDSWTKVKDWGYIVYEVVVSPNYATDQTVFAAAYSAILRSTDGGDTWTALDDNNGFAPDRGLASVELSPNYASDHTIFVADALNGVYKSTNSGTSWTQTGYIEAPLDLAISPAFTADDTIFAATPNGVEKTVDGGGDWNQVGSWDPCQEVLASPLMAVDGLAVASFSDTIRFSENSGDDWWGALLWPAMENSVGRMEMSPADATVFVAPNCSSGGTGSFYELTFSLTPTYNLTISVSPEDTGTVDGDPAGSYTEGSEITLTAHPDEGFSRFKHWTGIGPSPVTSNPVTFTMNSDKNVTAVFEQTSLAMDYTQAGGKVTFTASLVYPGTLTGKTVKFFASTNGGVTWALKTSGLTNAAGICTKPFTFTNGEYLVKAECTPAAGATKLTASPQGLSVTPVTVPPQPIGAAAITTDSMPEITWDEYAGTTGLTGYIIQTCPNSYFTSGVQEYIDDDGLPGAELDLSAYRGKKIFYRIVAYFPNGRSVPSKKTYITYKEQAVLTNLEPGISGMTIKPTATLLGLDSGTGVAFKTVYFFYRREGTATWLSLGYYKTDALGVVTRPLAKTLTAGNYELKAQFKGDAAYLGEIVETPFAVGLP